jgi:hypothetical protein
MSLISRFGLLVAAAAIAMAASEASAAPRFRAPTFRPVTAPMFHEGRMHHARVIPAHPPQNNYNGPPLPAPCPPGQARALRRTGLGAWGLFCVPIPLCGRWC